MAKVCVVRHVPWEGPHRIAAALADFELVEVDALTPGAELPAPGRLAGAVVMGGPMSANDDRRLPGIAAELLWIERLLAEGVPYLGVCLGSQLLARAAGAAVRPGARPEIGFAPVRATPEGERDPLVRHLAPEAVVLHWHGEVFELPAGAVSLAASELTEHQAFRLGDRAWGLLFHAEADEQLVAQWLREPVMRREARDALGPQFERLLTDAANAHAAELTRRGDLAFRAFARACAERASALS